MTIKYSSKRALTDEEEAEIQRMIADDPDSPEITEEQMRQAKPFAEALPELAESIKRSRGRPRKLNAKQALTLRLDPDTIARWEQSGKNWRARMAKALEKSAPK